MLTAEESMRNIQIDSRLQLLELGGDRPYFLKSNEQILALLRKKNRESKKNQNWEARGPLAGEEHWRRDLELAKSSILVEAPLEEEHPSLKTHVSNEMKRLVAQNLPNVGAEYSKHVIEQAMVQAVQNEFLAEDLEGADSGPDRLLADWDLKMHKLRRKMQTVSEPNKHDYDRVNLHKEFVQVDHRNQRGNLDRKFFVETVKQFCSQKTALARKFRQQFDEGESEPDNYSQVLSNSMVKDDAFRMKEDEVIKGQSSALRLKMEQKVRAIEEWAITLEALLSNAESQPFWKEIIDLVSANLKNRPLLLNLDRLQAHFDFLMVKYGGYPAVVGILRDVKASRQQALAEEGLGLSEAGFEERLFEAYPLADPGDNRRARELLALVEASHNALAKERIESLQACQWNEISKHATVEDFELEGFESQENDALGLIQGHLNERYLSRADKKVPCEFDKDGLCVFGLLYFLFVSGKFELLDKFMSQYSGRLRGAVSSLHKMFGDWFMCFRNCDQVDFFDEEKIQRRTRNNQAAREAFNKLEKSVSGDIFHVLLVETFLQTRLAGASQTQDVVDNYLDMLLLGLAKSLSFGLGAEAQGWSISAAQDSLRGLFAKEPRGVFGYAKEVVNSLLVPDALKYLAETSEHALESLHLAVFAGESGLLDVIDLYRDVHFNETGACSRDFVYQQTFKFAAEICETSPVEALLYLDLAPPVTHEGVSAMLAEYSALQENVEGWSASQMFRKGHRNERGKLSPVVQDSQMIMMNKQLQQIKLREVLSLVVGHNLFGVFLDTEPRSLGNLQILCTTASPNFVKSLFDLMCARAKDLKLSHFYHARLLEEQGRPRDLLDLFIFQEHELIFHVTGLVFSNMEAIKKALGRANSRSQRTDGEVQRMKGLLVQEIKEVCGGDSLRESSARDRMTYLEKIVFASENKQIFAKQERFHEASIMKQIRRILEHFLLLKGVKFALEQINNCDFYSQSFRFSNYLVSSYMMLVFFHLSLLKMYYNERIDSSSRWQITLSSIRQQALKIKQFYESKIVNMSMDIEISKKLSSTHVKIRHLINSFHCL